MRFRLITTVLLVLLSGCVVLAEGTGRLVGQITKFDNGKPVPFVNINLIGTSFTVQSDVDGNYMIENIPEGKYNCVAKSALLGGGTHFRVEIKKNKTKNKNVVLNFPIDTNPVKVKGKVIDHKTQLGLKGAKVIIENSDQGVVTDENGYFEFPPVLSKIYTFKIAAAGYETEFANDIVLGPEAIKEMDFYLKPQPVLISNTFVLKHKTIHNLYQNFEVLMDEGMVFSRQSDYRFTVKCTKENMKKIAKLVEQYDVPLKQVWIEVRLVLASMEKKAGSTLPQELKAVEEQFKTLFRYQNYEILDDAKVMVVEDNGCFLTIGGGKFAVNVSKVEIHNDIINLNNFTLEQTGNEAKTILSTFVNLTIGDTVVLGASNVDNSKYALIVTVNANVVK